jgi:hypothetical protein
MVALCTYVFGIYKSCKGCRELLNARMNSTQRVAEFESGGEHYFFAHQATTTPRRALHTPSVRHASRNLCVLSFRSRADFSFCESSRRAKPPLTLSRHSADVAETYGRRPDAPDAFARSYMHDEMRS